MLLWLIFYVVFDLFHLQILYKVYIFSASIHLSYYMICNHGSVFIGKKL